MAQSPHYLLIDKLHSGAHWRAQDHMTHYGAPSLISWCSCFPSSLAYGHTIALRSRAPFVEPCVLLMTSTVQYWPHRPTAGHTEIPAMCTPSPQKSFSGLLIEHQYVPLLQSLMKLLSLTPLRARTALLMNIPT